MGCGLDALVPGRGDTEVPSRRRLAGIDSDPGCGAVAVVVVQETLVSGGNKVCFGAKLLSADDCPGPVYPVDCS